MQESTFDVAILDVDMPGQDGFAVVRAARAQNVRLPIVFLTMHRDERFLNTALDLGVQGYVLKDSAVTDIVNGIRAVQLGQTYVSPALVSYLVNRRTSSGVVGLDSLTSAEKLGTPTVLTNLHPLRNSEDWCGRGSKASHLSQSHA